MTVFTRSPVKAWLIVAAIALLLSGFAQNHVEARRTEALLISTDPQEKQALEVGFMSLGGFRGILADALWVRAMAQQDSGRDYELKLLCDMILKLQPTFTQVHAFQAYNMSYNLAYKAENCDDKWYWVRSGLATLEKGLKRNLHNHRLWFELGFQYFDRLGDIKMGDCARLRNQDLPNLDELVGENEAKTEELRRTIWSSDQDDENGKPRPGKGHARRDENLRYAAYFFWKAMGMNTDPKPLRTERMFGQMIEHLGHWRSKNPGHEKTWEDWGAEDWYVEVMRRNKVRGYFDDQAESSLRFLMWTQLDFWSKRADKPIPLLDPEASKAVQAIYKRYQAYFPDNTKSIPQILELYRSATQKARDRELKLPPLEPK